MPVRILVWMSSKGTSTWVSVTPGLASENFLSVSSWTLSFVGVSSSNQTCKVRCPVLAAGCAAGAAGLVGSAGLAASAGLVGAAAGAAGGAAAAGLAASAGLAGAGVGGAGVGAGAEQAVQSALAAVPTPSTPRP